MGLFAQERKKRSPPDGAVSVKQLILRMVHTEDFSAVPSKLLEANGLSKPFEDDKSTEDGHFGGVRDTVPCTEQSDAKQPGHPGVLTVASQSTHIGLVPA